MEILGRIEITVGPDILRSENTLSPAQKALVRQLILKTVNRGNWLKKSITRVLEEEMFHTSREMGPEARAQVEELLHGIWVSVNTPPESEEESADDRALLANIADNVRDYERLSPDLMRYKLGMIYKLTSGYLEAP